MRLSLPYPPSVNRYWRMVRGMMILSAEARAYKKHVAFECIGQLGCAHEAHKGPVSVSIGVHRPKRCGDLDNTLKAVLDSIKGIAYDDDSQVVEIHAFRHEDKLRPRVEITIEALTQ